MNTSPMSVSFVHSCGCKLRMQSDHKMISDLTKHVILSAESSWPDCTSFAGGAIGHLPSVVVQFVKNAAGAPPVSLLQGESTPTLVQKLRSLPTHRPLTHISVSLDSTSSAPSDSASLGLLCSVWGFPTEEPRGERPPHVPHPAHK